jgi:hypothetical protein
VLYSDITRLGNARATARDKKIDNPQVVFIKPCPECNRSVNKPHIELEDALLIIIGIYAILLFVEIRHENVTDILAHEIKDQPIGVSV